MENTKTPLYGEHVEAGARIVPFAGFCMPLQYSGILAEHRAVREAMGMFDLSHMGEFRVTGPDAVAAVDRLVTNDIRGLEVNQVRYTPMSYPDGGIVDDLLVYRFPDYLLLVVNAANIDKDLAWVQENLEGDARVENFSGQVALIAVQGPRSESFLQTLTDVDLVGIAFYHFAVGRVAGVDAIISRTGYTGEDGFELYVAPEDASRLWRTLRERGAPQGLQLAGLGARDTLRLEAGYMLYGNDIDQHTTPIEAGLGWTVRFGEHDFIGRGVLERQKAEGPQRRMVALEMPDRRSPRPHFPIYRAGERIGDVTSGTFSPTLNHGIGLGYVRRDAARPGTDIEIQIREQLYPARVARKPLYKREGE